ncbi:MAG: hypothetical protein PHN44_03675 [Candidatus Marinimicrobia bacterium]|jgi:hypothetical protein|nr:hypothetical protein [Candidatus Neomarinimicrobiota bacterium]MDD5539316.1 hypothetical protein [Candidatus Neomarinimicrobiota bacterium]
MSIFSEKVQKAIAEFKGAHGRRPEILIINVENPVDIDELLCLCGAESEGLILTFDNSLGLDEIRVK